MAETDVSGAPFSGRTAWTRNLQTPLRSFLQTETGSAAVLLAAVVAALVWANVDPASYDRVWTTTLSIHVGAHSISMDLRGWINSGLMAFFFFVIGLEARREFDLGELRERRRVALPLLAGLGGMVVPVAIYLAINAGHNSAHGWGAAMSTDTAFALGLLALVGSGLPDRLRAYLLTVAVVDPLGTTVRTVGLPEQPARFADLRMRDGLDPKAHFTQQKQVSVLEVGKSFVVADAVGSRFETYDSLAKVYGLYMTLSNDPKLAEFAFVLTWPKLKDAEKR